MFFFAKTRSVIELLIIFFRGGSRKNLLTAVTEILPYIKIQTDKHLITIKVSYTEYFLVWFPSNPACHVLRKWTFPVQQNKPGRDGYVQVRMER